MSSVQHLKVGGALIAALAVMASPAAARQQDGPVVDALIEVLVAQGTITRQQADDLLQAARTRASAGASSAPPAVAAAPSVPPVPTAPVRPAAPDLEIDWSEGSPEFSGEDSAFRTRGRILADGQSTFGSEADGRNITTTGARALRLGVEGVYKTNVFYQFEADFADGQTEVTSAYFGWRQKLGDDVTTEINVGSRLTERGIDGSTGSDQTPFLERNAVGVGLIPVKGFFGIGLTSKTFGPNWHFTAVAVGDPISGDSGRDDVITLMARGHWNPVITDRGFIHLGGWAFTEDFPDQLASLTVNTRVANRYNDVVRVNAGPLVNPDHTVAFGLEAGGVRDGLWTFAEYGERNIEFREGAPVDEARLKAWSVAAGWVLTGERAPFSRRGGTFGRLKVDHPITDGGRGALELLLRYDAFDYADAPQGAFGDTWTAGLNWYLNDLSRIMINVVHFDTDNVVGDVVGPDSGDSIGTRFQISF